MFDELIATGLKVLFVRLSAWQNAVTAVITGGDCAGE